ncbi:probable inactive poly [ADP-ribose] polymerase SRO5 [Pyrus x bretschneideri]|uniref:probable inactive poly [ADP-ribose] polymerase SRO5 n=1 Tax=Pyrus x bretschneideri TaxID=225117 RepID=UPI00203078BB|nr:probable inactive poly [ADP-ribose] polymerase SRO5 [Pyrus x bretschneideri]
MRFNSGFVCSVVSGVPTMQQSALRPPPTSPWMTFPALMSVLSKFLPPQKMQLLVACHNEFRANKVTRAQLIQRVRQIAGDRLLIGVIKSVKRQIGARADA